MLLAFRWTMRVFLTLIGLGLLALFYFGDFLAFFDGILETILLELLCRFFGRSPHRYISLLKCCSTRANRQSAASIKGCNVVRCGGKSFEAEKPQGKVSRE